MVGMFLSATEDQEVDYWLKQITTYRDLLRAHSVNFNVTRLAVVRMDLLLQCGPADTTGGEQGADPSTTGTHEVTREPDQPYVQQASVVEGYKNDISAELRYDFPIDPAIAFGNTYGLEWDADIDQLLSNFG